MTNKDTKELIIARLESMPDTFRITLGGSSSMSKADLIKHVKQNDEIGAKIITVQLNYLKRFKNLA